MKQEKWRIGAKMNINARNTLLIILERKGIQIPELEEAIETAYEYYYDRRDEIERETEEEEKEKIKND